MTPDSLRVQVEGGDGVVHRNGPAVLLAFPTSDAQDTMLDDVLRSVDEAAMAGGGDVGRKLVRRLVGTLAAAEPDDVPDFALVVVGDGTTALLLNGSVDVTVVGAAGEERFSGRSVSSWLDRVVDTEITELRAHRSDRDDVRPGRRSDLRSGSVPAGGVVLGSGVAVSPPDEPTVDQVIAPPSPAEAPTPPAPPPPEAPAPAAPAPVAPEPEAPPAPVSFESIALDEPLPPEEEPAPLPVAAEAVGAPAPSGGSAVEVSGILCSRQHFNDPSASFCSACGISMVHQTHNLVRGPRPPLGVLLADDGATFALDRDYVIGREPEEHELVRSGKARAIPLEDPDRTISRAHAQVMLDGWDVRIVDLHSANGTHVAGPSQTEWTALHPEEPATLTPGSRVLVGQRTFVYDSHHRS